MIFSGTNESSTSRDTDPLVCSMSLTIPNLVPQRPFCYLNFISAAKPQKFENETYDAHVLVNLEGNILFMGNSYTFNPCPSE